MPNDRAVQLELPLVMPDTASLIAAVESRRVTIAESVLSAARRRAFLQRVWQLDEPDGVPVFVTSQHVLHCAPEGVERLGNAIALEQALKRDAVAIDDFLQAARNFSQAAKVFESGGRLALDELDDGALPPDLQHDAKPPARPSSPASPEGREFTAALRQYLAELQAERLDVSAERRRLIDVEYRAVQRRLAEHLGHESARDQKRRRPTVATARRALKRSA